jgi:XRE family transcriptional regulator, regulator of sulfur utilization
VTTYSHSQVGEALAKLRRQHGYSLHDVASATGISRSFLSLVENGRSDITMGRLLRLVTFYGAHITEVLPFDEPHDLVVVRREHRQQVESPTEGMLVSLLAPERDRKMTPSLAVVEATGVTAEHSSHSGEEFMYVLQGSISLEFLDAEPIILREGDSAYFDAIRPHLYRNAADEPSSFLTISTPRTF